MKRVKMKDDTTAPYGFEDLLYMIGQRTGSCFFFGAENVRLYTLV